MTFKEYIDYSDFGKTKYLNTDLRFEDLTDIYGIENYKYITSLELESNKIVDIEPLKYLNKLKFLSVCDNKVSDISCLKNLNLKKLDLESNPISNIDVIYYMKNLNGIYLYNTNITGLLSKYADKDYYLEDDDLKSILNIIKIERRKKIISEL